MIIKEYLNSIESNPNYIVGSLYLKSWDNTGCVYKWLEKNSIGSFRKQVFITLNPEESDIELINKTFIDSIDIFPAH